MTSKKEKSEKSNNGDSDQNISNKIDFVWRCIGTSDDGRIMIAPDITKDSPKMYLKGATGYLNGPDELKRLCEVLYSTDKGTARSMTIEDVNKLLGYTVKMGAYYNASGSYTPTLTPMTISDLESQNGVSITNRTTPYVTTEEDKNLGTYTSNFYKFNKGNDIDDITYPDNIQYVFYGLDGVPY